MTRDEVTAHVQHLTSWSGPDTDQVAKEAFWMCMSGRNYGREETIDAWHHFLEGWQATGDPIVTDCNPEEAEALKRFAVMRKRFEYEVVQVDAAQLNEMGKQGWEAVGTMTDKQSDGYGNTWNVHTVLMKREVLPQ